MYGCQPLNRLATNENNTLSIPFTTQVINMRNTSPKFKKCLVCSIGHMTLDDSVILKERSWETASWIAESDYGLMISLYNEKRTLLRLKHFGLSKSLRKFILKMIQIHHIHMIEFDRDGDVIEGEEFFEW